MPAASVVAAVDPALRTAIASLLATETFRVWAGIERLRLGLADGLDAAPRPRWPLDSLAGSTDEAATVTE